MLSGWLLERLRIKTIHPIPPESGHLGLKLTTPYAVQHLYEQGCAVSLTSLGWFYYSRKTHQLKHPSTFQWEGPLSFSEFFAQNASPCCSHQSWTVVSRSSLSSNHTQPTQSFKLIVFNKFQPGHLTSQTQSSVELEFALILSGS